MEKYEWKYEIDMKLFLTGKYWNPLDANKIEEALPGPQQKTNCDKKKFTTCFL